MQRLWLGLLLVLVTGAGALSQTAKTPTALLQEWETCAALGQPSGCHGSATQIQDIIASLGSFRTPVSVTDYGAVANNSTDATAAIQAADNAASAAGVALFFPPGMYAVSSQINANANWFSVGGGATLRWTTDIGQTNCASNSCANYITIQSTDETAAGVVFEGTWIDRINLMGPNCTSFECPNSGPGTLPANMDGFKFGSTQADASQPYISDMKVEGFRNGFVMDTEYGHETFDQVSAKNNFYGLYVVAGGGDNKIFNSYFQANTMCGIAGGWNSGDFLTGNTHISNTDFGFTPYGICREPSIGAVQGYSGFMDGGTLLDDRWECTGNAAFKVMEAFSSANEAPVWQSTKIVHPGFDWWGSAYCNFTGPYGFSVAPQSKTCTVTPANNPGSGTYAGSGVLTNCGTSTTFQFGQAIEGTGIPANTFVLADNGSGTVRISLAVTSTQGAETVTAAFDNPTFSGSATGPAYAIDVADIEGVIDIDQGASPDDVYNRGGAFEPGYSGAILHSQSCSATTGTAGGRLILRYTGAEPPPTGAAQVPLMVVDSDPYDSGCVAHSRITYPAEDLLDGFNGTNLVGLIIAQSATNAVLDWTLSSYGMSLTGLSWFCQSTKPSYAVVSTSSTQGSGATINDVATTVAIGSAAPSGGVPVNCMLNAPE